MDTTHTVKIVAGTIFSCIAAYSFFVYGKNKYNDTVEFEYDNEANADVDTTLIKNASFNNFWTSYDDNNFICYKKLKFIEYCQATTTIQVTETILPPPNHTLGESSSDLVIPIVFFLSGFALSFLYLLGKTKYKKAKSKKKSTVVSTSEASLPSTSTSRPTELSSDKSLLVLLLRYLYVVLCQYFQQGNTSEVDTPGGSTPEVETPEYKTPELNTPDMNTPEVNTPEANTPEVNTPEVNTPEVNSSGGSTPKFKTPELNTPDMNTPEVNTPEANTPEVKTPEVKTPEVNSPEVKTPEAKSPQANTPEANTPEIKTPEANTPEVKTPEVKAPEVKTPEVKTPEVKTPEVNSPEVNSPEAKSPQDNTPEVKTPEVKTPEIKTPEVNTPEIKTPEVNTPVVKTPQDNTPEANTLEVKTPEAKSPQDNTPEANTPEANTPEAKTPEVKTPEVKTPEVNTPEVKRPEVKRPEVKTPEVNTPEVRTPEVKTPEVKTPEAKTPEVKTPEVKTPEVKTPGSSTPSSSSSGSSRKKDNASDSLVARIARYIADKLTKNPPQVSTSKANTPAVTTSGSNSSGASTPESEKYLTPASVSRLTDLSEEDILNTLFILAGYVIKAYRPDYVPLKGPEPEAYGFGAFSSSRFKQLNRNDPYIAFLARGIADLLTKSLSHENTSKVNTSEVNTPKSSGASTLEDERYLTEASVSRLNNLPRDAVLELVVAVAYCIDEALRPGYVSSGNKPKVDTPEVNTPEIKTPEVNSPVVNSPEAKSPEAKSPEVKSPEVKSPEANSPEANSPKVNSPEVKTPGSNNSDKNLVRDDAPPNPAFVSPPTVFQSNTGHYYDEFFGTTWGALFEENQSSPGSSSRNVNAIIKNSKVLTIKEKILQQAQAYNPKSKLRCNFWPDCKKTRCNFTHPVSPCRHGDNCFAGHICSGYHPRDLLPRPKRKVIKGFLPQNLPEPSKK